jgi:hypothetical protein
VEMAMTAPKVVRTMCPMNCHPTFCGMLVEVDGGKLSAVTRTILTVRASFACAAAAPTRSLQSESVALPPDS